MLRPYQKKCISDLYDWFGQNKDGNPCLELVTGAGKSHILAEICKDAVHKFRTNVLIITHQKELVEQDYEKIKLHGVEDVGICSAGVGKYEPNKSVVVAGIQSIYQRPHEFANASLVIVDEAHVPNHKDEGMYRRFLSGLKEHVPNLRIVGLTSTPWRLGHGYIHEGSALFDDLIRPVGIKELMDDGYLCLLRSKFTDLQLDTDGVKKRGGEYIESELQKKLNKDIYNGPAIKEIMLRGAQQKAWLIFATGIDHALTLRDMIRDHGITCETVTGKTPKKERESILERFKNGEIRCVTNCSVLTTGFDNPRIDLVAMMRPTMSPTLYAQIIGRGLRPHPDKEFCLILDFAGNISTHGPITKVRPPHKKGDGKGEAPVKVCENCQEIVHLSVQVCPACGTEFPKPTKERTRLHQDDIMGLDKNFELKVTKWRWAKYTSQKTGKTMLKVTYYGGLSDLPVKQFFTIYHKGQAGNYARIKLFDILQKAGVKVEDMAEDPSNIAKACNKGIPPSVVKYEKNGKFFSVTKVIYE